MGYYRGYPTKRVDAPKVTKKDLDFLNEDEILLFLEALENEPLEYKCLFTLRIYTDTTKTQESQRSLKVPGNILDIIKAHKVEKAKERLRLGDKWQNSNRLFTKYDGSLMSLNTTYTKLQKILINNGLRPVSLHSLRHPYGMVALKRALVGFCQSVG